MFIMHFFHAATFTLFLSSTILGAPTPTLDSSVFLHNGQEAQILNAEFASLKVTDRCNDGELACVKNSVATCGNFTWQLVPCSGQSEICFALPSTTDKGTVLTCTTNSTALALISATGATGGIAVKSGNTTVDFPTECDGDHSASNITETYSTSATVSATSGTTSPSHSTVREVTVTVTIVPTSTLPSETLTLDPSAASSLLSSLATDSNVSITTILPSSVSAATSAKVTSTAKSRSVDSSSISSANSRKSASSTSSSLPVIVPASTITLAPLITAHAQAASSFTSVHADGGYYGV